jgi:hypothetical protein
VAQGYRAKCEGDDYCNWAYCVGIKYTRIESDAYGDRHRDRLVHTKRQESHIEADW